MLSVRVMLFLEDKYSHSENMPFRAEKRIHFACHAGLMQGRWAMEASLGIFLVTLI